jgi:hypothetical protein
MVGREEIIVLCFLQKDLLASILLTILVYVSF